MCKYCETENNDFTVLNDTVEYSGLEMSINRQGMFRVRYYSDSSEIFYTQDIINIDFCPKCGRKFKNVRI